MLITICDVPEDRKSDVERSGGKIARIWNAKMDVQFKDCYMMIINKTLLIIPNGCVWFIVDVGEYGNIYIQ